MMNENRDTMHNPSETPPPPATRVVLLREVIPPDGLQQAPVRAASGVAE